MLKKTITFEDFDGKEVTEDHYFHLSKADLVEMEVSHDGGMQEHLQKIVDAGNNKEIIEEFKVLIRRSYGQRVDGRFIKDPKLTEAFMASEAYSEFFMGLITDTNAAVEFVNGVVPHNLAQEVAKLEAQQMKTPETVREENGMEPTPSGDAQIIPRILSEAEMKEMNSDELQSGLATGRYKLS